jgi:integrase/recombinase XerC
MDLLSDYRRALAAHGHAKGTIDTYLVILRRLDRELPYGLAGAHTDELAEYALTAQRSPATRALYRAALRSFFGWATDPRDPRLDYDPSRHLPAQRVPRGTARPVSDRQLAAILAWAREPYRTWYVLAAYAGLRCVEIAALRRDDVTPETVYVHGKGGHTRTVPTHPLVWATVKDLPDGPLAPANRKAIAGRGNRHLRSIAARATMHQLRKWYGTTALDACGNLRVVQDLLGHASPATTAVYTAVSTRQQRSAVLALPDLSGSGGVGAG